jgi:hypothetical protein
LKFIIILFNNTIEKKMAFAAIAVPAAELGYLAFAGVVAFLIPAGIQAIQKIAECIKDVQLFLC